MSAKNNARSEKKMDRSAWSNPSNASDDRPRKGQRRHDLDDVRRKPDYFDDRSEGSEEMENILEEVEAACCSSSINANGCGIDSAV